MYGDFTNSSGPLSPPPLPAQSLSGPTTKKTFSASLNVFMKYRVASDDKR